MIKFKKYYELQLLCVLSTFKKVLPTIFLILSSKRTEAKMMMF